MSLFRSIMDKIFHHGSSTASAAPGDTSKAAQPSTGASPAASAGAPAQSTGTPAQSTATAGASTQMLRSVDVDAVLTKLAATKGGGGNWRTSIVDLLKMLDLDSSLAARKELARELNVRAGADGSAEQNIALSKAVMQKLAENGGKVPESLRT